MHYFYRDLPLGEQVTTSEETDDEAKARRNARRPNATGLFCLSLTTPGAPGQKLK
jgi:hypothetical protein